MAEGAIPKLGGIVEIDETYVGFKQKGKGVYYGKKQKQTVMGAVQREGNLKLAHVKDSTRKSIQPFIESSVDRNVERLMTDQTVLYPYALENFTAPS